MRKADETTRLEEVIDRFEDAWQGGGRPAVDDHLADGDRSALLVELVHVDLEYRLKAGEAVRVEDYLRRYPELGRERTVLLELLAAEWRLRRRAEPSLTAEEYERRFPGFGDDLTASATAVFRPAAFPPPLAADDPANRDTPPVAGRDEPTAPAGPAAVEPIGGAETQSHYHILRLHARGGLGEVLAARDEQLHREVALKRLLRRPGQETESRSRFLREAEITSQLEHPGVVPVYGLGQSADGSPVYAMRLIRGETFQEAVERYHRGDRPGRHPAARTLEFRQLLGRFLSVCNTVAYAHSRGVLHRDLKPGNILLGSYGETMVVDWGLAKTAAGSANDAAGGAAVADPAADLTQAGEVIGTPAFMSPEQADGRWDMVGLASDVYSLGATLYVLLTGRAPFGLGTVGEVLDKVRRADFPAPRQVKKGVSPALQAVCLKAMAARPADRYADVLALAADLEKWLAGEPAAAWREPATARVRRWVGRRPALVAAAAVGLAACAGLAVVTALWFAAAEREQGANKLSHVAQELADLRRSQLERADRERYYLHIAAADRDWWADRFDAAARHLADCKPELHGWEWNYMARRGRDAESLLTLKGHAKEVWNVAFSPDGGRVASASLDGTARVWDAADGRQLFNLEGHAGPVWGLAFNRDGTLLATGGGDRSVRLWDAATGELVRSFTDLPGEVRAVAFSPDGKTLATSADDTCIKLWDAEQGRLLRTLHGHTQGIANVAFSADGGRLASASDDQAVKVWKVGIARASRTLCGHKHGVLGVAVSPDGRVASAGLDAPGEGMAADDAAVRVWDAAGRELAALALPGGSRCVAFSPDGRLLAAAGDDRAVHLWDTAGWAERVLVGHGDKVLCVAFSPDGQTLASASADHTVRLWDAATGKELRALHGHEDKVRSVAFSADGRRLASGGDDKVVKLWEPATGEEERTLSGAATAVRGLAFSPDGQRLAAATAGFQRVLTMAAGETVVWDLETGQTALTLYGHNGDVRTVAYSPDGQLLLSGGSDGWLRFWEPTTGQEIFTIYDAHLDCVNAVAFGKDGDQLASASCDGTVILWNGAPFNQ